MLWWYNLIIVMSNVAWNVELNVFFESIQLIFICCKWNENFKECEGCG